MFCFGVYSCTYSTVNQKKEEKTKEKLNKRRNMGSTGVPKPRLL